MILIRNIFILIITTILISSCSDNLVQPPIIDPPYGLYTVDYYPAWSPEGNIIAYVNDKAGEGGPGLFLIDTNGANKRIIHNGIINSPSWSPDGEWIVFGEGKQIYKIKADGSSLTQLTFEGENYSPEWSPDGEWIVYERDYGFPEPIDVKGIWRVKPDGSNIEQVYSGFAGYPFWDNASGSIFFLRGAVLQNGHVVGDTLWKYMIHNTNIQYILFLTEPANYDNRYPEIASDNYSITFTSQPNNGSSPQIWIINTDGTGLRKLTTEGGYTSDWSPDGKRIAYCNSSEASGRLWIMSKDGSGKKQLTFEENY